MDILNIVSFFFTSFSALPVKRKYFYVGRKKMNLNTDYLQYFSTDNIFFHLQDVYIVFSFVSNAFFVLFFNVNLEYNFWIGVTSLGIDYFCFCQKFFVLFKKSTT